MELIPTLQPSAKEFANPIDYLSEAKVQRLGHKYGMVKIVPPEDFRPHFSINKESFKFNVRVQNLAELNILNRSRMFFVKQLNNFNRAKRIKKSQRLTKPYIMGKDGQKVYLYDLFIMIIKECDTTSRESAKLQASRIRRKRAASSHLEGPRTESTGPLPSLSDIMTSGNVWKCVSRKLKIPVPILQDVFEQYISKYYSYIAAQTRTHGSNQFSKLLYNEEYPKSLLSDEEAKSSESESEESEDEGCVVCDRSNKPTKMILCDSCDKPFHLFCLSPPLNTIPKGEWICDNCIVGNGYYGFKEEKHLYTLSEFKERCNSREAELTTDLVTGKKLSIERLEHKFWNYVNDIENTITVKYGADVSGDSPGEISGFPSLGYTPEDLLETDKQKFAEVAKHPMNLLNLPNAKGSLLPMFDRKISGMTVPWIYVGSTFSTFCWHLEDQYTLSANYQHEGAPKVWYSIPEYSCNQFNNLMESLAPDLFDKQPDLLHQLVTLVSPYDKKFQNANVTCYKAVQRPNEYIVTFPKCYHAGFNSGYNFNEAVNFTLDSWVPYGIEAINDYQLTGKQCVFDMLELMLNVIIEFLRGSTSFQEGLVRTCYSELLNVLNAKNRMIKQLPEVSVNPSFLKRIVRNDYSRVKEHNLPSPKAEEDQSMTLTHQEDSDAVDFDVFCSKCHTICFMAFMIHYKVPNPRKRRKLHSFTVTKINELRGDKDLEVLCLKDYLSLLKETYGKDDYDRFNDDDNDDPFKHDELNYIRDPQEVRDILSAAGPKIERARI